MIGCTRRVDCDWIVVGLWLVHGWLDNSQMAGSACVDTWSMSVDGELDGGLDDCLGSPRGGQRNFWSMSVDGELGGGLDGCLGGSRVAHRMATEYPHTLTRPFASYQANRGPTTIQPQSNHNQSCDTATPSVWAACGVRRSRARCHRLAHYGTTPQ